MVAKRRTQPFERHCVRHFLAQGSTAQGVALVKQQIGVSGIGPVSLGGVFFQNVRLGTKLPHQRNDDTVAVVRSLLLIGGDAV